MKMEGAKRRALFSMLSLGIPLQPLHDPNAKGAVNEHGQAVPLALSYRILQPLPNAPVITGHDAGTITLNLEEADDAIRERNRMNLNEPYRTLLGHFRHEIGHYYWSMWFENDPKGEEVLGAFRELFGDESADYGAAMNAYYSNGAQVGWQERCISAYSTMHPWEEWAETWAHYLHMIDALESFESLGLRKSAAMPKETIEKIVPLPKPFQSAPVAEFTHKLQTWLEITPAINELSSSLGHNMSYPFVVSAPVVRKLFFIHCMVKRQVNEAKNQPSTAATQAR
ncbi:putative zinc-binding metallopeptidase [Prosthecobacter sp.]|uniref:putative zinc-binding metallopeptidase n=1 Tax=Prosthecobacter sp. TaxID=1965333 RepID=UPI002488DC4C|nr:putative zinc-binding metallopeptidase [Prosthecobacter sp.]MDI1313373.1 putative zinc-binding metallopeptidase [Prosthecobacter sp.]